MKALIILRDRVTYARQCAEALTAAGLDVHIIDRESTWPPAVDWLHTCGMPVHYRHNGHPRDLWDWAGLYRIVGNNPYVVTDPDVVPDHGCPPDWPSWLAHLLHRYPVRVKAGLGLRIDNLPEHYTHAGKVREWEAQYWASGVEPGVYSAWVDTTLAMYQPLNAYPTFALGPALRTGGQYVAQHLTWYEDSADPGDEISHYRRQAVMGLSHWADPDLYTGSAR